MDAGKRAHFEELLLEELARISEEPDCYAICTVCGEQIAANRLEIVPATRFCERHAPA